MSSLTPSHRFLLDENVRSDLYKFLMLRGLDVTTAPRSAPDSLLASLSKKEKRILVTNDEDFGGYTEDKLFSVVLLKIPQNNGQILIDSFTKMLSECDNFVSKLIVLKVGAWKAVPLIRKLSLTP